MPYTVVEGDMKPNITRILDSYTNNKITREVNRHMVQTYLNTTMGELNKKEQARLMMEIAVLTSLFCYDGKTLPTACPTIEVIANFPTNLPIGLFVRIMHDLIRERMKEQANAELPIKAIC
jgi:hypothetical protein